MVKRKYFVLIVFILVFSLSPKLVKAGVFVDDGFENDFTGWTVTGSPQISTDWSHHGAKSMVAWAGGYYVSKWWSETSPAFHSFYVRTTGTPASNNNYEDFFWIIKNGGYYGLRVGLLKTQDGLNLKMKAENESTILFNWLTNTDYFFEIEVDATANLAKLYVDDVYKLTVSYWASPSAGIQIGARYRYGGGGWATYIDCVRISDTRIYSEATNSDPVNDGLNSTSTFYTDNYGWSNVTVSDPDLVADLKTVDLEIVSGGGSASLRWNQSSNVFSEISDPSAIVTLDVSGSTRINIDTDTDKICFRFLISSAVGSVDVNVTSTDDADAVDLDNYPSEFTVSDPPEPPDVDVYMSVAAPSLVKAEDFFIVKAVVRDDSNYQFIDNVSLSLNGLVNLTWSKPLEFDIVDVHDFATYDVGDCDFTIVNASSFEVSWMLRLERTFEVGSINIVGEAYRNTSETAYGYFTFDFEVPPKSAGGVIQVNPVQQTIKDFSEIPDDSKISANKAVWYITLCGVVVIFLYFVFSRKDEVQSSSGKDFVENIPRDEKVEREGYGWIVFLLIVLVILILISSYGAPVREFLGGLFS